MRERERERDRERQRERGWGGGRERERGGGGGRERESERGVMGVGGRNLTENLLLTNNTAVNYLHLPVFFLVLGHF